MNDPTVSVLWGVLPFVPPFLVMIYLCFVRRVHCPECGARLPGIVGPHTKTRRQWLEGGTNCPHCGIDVDVKGRKVG